MQILTQFSGFTTVTLLFTLFWLSGCGSAGTSDVEIPELDGPGVVCEINGQIFEAANFDLIINRFEDVIELRADNAQVALSFIAEGQQAGEYTGGEVTVIANIGQNEAWNTNSGTTVFNVLTIDLENNTASGTFSEAQQNGNELIISAGEFLDVPVTVIE